MGAQRLDRLILLHADHAAAWAGHADVGDVRGAAGQDAKVRRGHVRVRADHRGHATVEVPAEADLLARRLGVHVDEHVVDAVAEALEHRVDLDERRPPGPQVEVAREVHDAEPHSVALDDRVAAARLRAQVVRRAHDPRLVVEVRVDLLAVIGVVAERDDVDARGEQLVGDLRGDPEAAGDVLAVDDDEGGREALAEAGEQAEQRPPPEAADEIADEEDGRRGVGHGAYSRAQGR